MTFECSKPDVFYNWTLVSNAIWKDVKIMIPWCFYCFALSFILCHVDQFWLILRVFLIQEYIQLNILIAWKFYFCLFRLSYVVENSHILIDLIWNWCMHVIFRWKILSHTLKNMRIDLTRSSCSVSFCNSLMNWQKNLKSYENLL
jgi:hypothetical protein